MEEYSQSAVSTQQWRDMFARELRLLLPANTCLQEFETDSAPQQIVPEQTPYVRVRTQRELPTHPASVVSAAVELALVGLLEPQLASASF